LAKYNDEKQGMISRKYFEISFSLLLLGVEIKKHVGAAL